MDIMADEVARAVRAHRKIYVGLLDGVEPRGIFTSGVVGGIAFTAWSPECAGHNPVVPERYVSLDVRLRTQRDGDTRRLLDAKGWVNGLLFFESYKAREAVFGWPSSWIQ